MELVVDIFHVGSTLNEVPHNFNFVTLPCLKSLGVMGDYLVVSVKLDLLFYIMDTFLKRYVNWVNNWGLNLTAYSCVRSVHLVDWYSGSSADFVKQAYHVPATQLLRIEQRSPRYEIKTYFAQNSCLATARFPNY